MDMIKKTVLTALVLLGAINLYAQEEEIIPWRQDITMLVVPREPQAIQVAQDLSRRYPVMIVCYQLAPTGPVLHAWNGKSWVGISTNDYTNGTFFTQRPRHAVIVEQQGLAAPEILIPNGTWCDSGNRLTSSEPRVMIHLLGRYFDFPYRYWMQFSKRYNYALEEINPALINVLWWHYRGDKVIPAFKSRDFDRDMDKWLDLEITPPAPIEPVLIEAEPEALPPAETPASELPSVEIVDTPVAMPTEVVEVVVAEPAVEVEAVQAVAAPAETVEKTEAEIIEEIEDVAPVAEINPFSTNDIPAAELIIHPAAE
jgi:hypothetical protein